VKNDLESRVIGLTGCQIAYDCHVKN